jgi:small subunit ribosomal protein S10e
MLRKSCHDAEGVLWAPKDYSLAEHPNMPGVKNLYVIKAMQSFESKEYVTERYAWRNLYWFLTDEGIEYLRGYLNIPAEVVPATLMKSTRCVTASDPFPHARLLS